jgi:hypothetical protein
MRIIKIGKSHSNDIVIDSDSTVSREHIEIFIDDERNVFVTDKNSLNGTFVNGTKIFESKKLGRYDILRIGNTLINWRDYLDAVDESVNETIADDISGSNTRTVHERGNYDDDSKKNKKKNRNKIYLWSFIIIVISVIAAYFYFTQDSKRICTTWKSKDKSGLSYTFNDDGTFEKDSNDITKTGTYTILKGRENKIKLKFDKESLPVYSTFLFTDNTNKLPFPREVDYDREFENYYGNLFNLTNSSDYDIKILSISQQTIKSNEINVNSKLYISDKNYKYSLNRSRDFKGFSYTNSEDWNLVSDVTEFIEDSELIHFDLDDVIVEEGETLSMMLLTKDFVSVTYGDAITEDENLSFSDGVSSETFDNVFYHYTDGPSNWNGDIEYGIMNSKFELEYEFVGGNLELNGKLFKRK